MRGIRERLQAMGLVLPKPPSPAGSYRAVLETGGWLYVSGQLSRSPDGLVIAGRVGCDLNLDEARGAARAAALNALSALLSHTAEERIERIVRVTGYVQVTDAFHDISRVLDGASDFFCEVLGEAGTHVRSAVGVKSLPVNASVELEVTAKLKE